MTNRQAPAINFKQQMSLHDESQKAYADFEAVRRNKYTYLCILYDYLKAQEPTEDILTRLATIDHEEAAALLKWQNLSLAFKDAVDTARNEVKA